MPAFTARMSMYMPGGGSLGIGGDDEVADIDRINQSLQKLDSNVGVPSYDTFPENPFPGQVAEKGGFPYYWNANVSMWKQIAPHVGETPPDNPQEGYLWADTN